MSQSLYEFLGLSKNASPDVIRAAINTVADRHAASGADATQARMLTLCAEILLVPEKRKDYDKRRSEKEAGASQNSFGNEADAIKKIDFTVLLITLPIALSSPLMLLIAIGPMIFAAKAISISMYGIMSVVVGILSAIEIYNNSDSDDPLSAFLMFLVVSFVFPLGYMWYMFGRNRLGLKAMFIIPFVSTALSLFLFAYPAIKSENAFRDAVEKQERASNEQIDRIRQEVDARRNGIYVVPN